MKEIKVTIIVLLHMLYLSVYAANEAEWWENLPGCDTLGLWNQPLCSLVGGTSGRIRYDPVKWLATRQRVVEPYKLMTKHTSKTYAKIAAPDIALKAAEQTSGWLASKKVEVNMETDALWCSDQHCTSMLDLVIDKNGDGLTALLQMQRGSYYGTSAAGKYFNKREHKWTEIALDTLNWQGIQDEGKTHYNYEATDYYAQYHATDALIATNAILRSFVAANIQGSYAVKSKYAIDDKCNECTRFIYNGNPCTGWPIINGTECTHPKNVIVIIPTENTNAGKVYKEAKNIATKIIKNECRSIDNCEFKNIATCLSTINEVCKSIHKDKTECGNGTWKVPLYDENKKVQMGYGTAISLKDELWDFKTDQIKQYEWLNDKYNVAKSIAEVTSEVMINGTTFSGIEPWDATSYELLHALRDYPFHCTPETNISLLEELNLVGTYVNCSYTTTDDTYEGLLSTNINDSNCVKSDNTKYEYYSSPKRKDVSSAVNLYDGMYAFIIANNSRCLRLNGKPPSRFCQPEGKQYLQQLRNHNSKIANDAITAYMAATTVTMTKPGFAIAFVCAFIGIIGASIAINVSTINVEQNDTLAEPFVSDTFSIPSSSTEPFVPKMKNITSMVNPFMECYTNQHGKRMGIISAWFAYISIVLTMVTVILNDYQTEKDNGGGKFLPWNVGVVSQDLTMEAVANDRYDSGYIYTLTETTIVVTVNPHKRWGLIIGAFVLLLSFFPILYFFCRWHPNKIVSLFSNLFSNSKPTAPTDIADLVRDLEMQKQENATNATKVANLARDLEIQKQEHAKDMKRIDELSRAVEGRKQD